MSAFTQLREDALDRVGVVPGQVYTITYEHRGAQKTLRHMRFVRADNFGISFYQQTKGGEREHIFDGPELIAADLE